MTGDLSWRFAHASVTGTSHVGSNTGCQDACAASLIETRCGPILVIALSDGAGSAKSSDVGSKIAVTGIIDATECWFAGGRPLEEISEAVVRDWIAGIVEQIAEEAGSSGNELRDYAATLLFAVLGPSGAVFSQLGDGAMVVLTAEHEWSWVFWPMHGEYANTTYFITDPTALKLLKFESRQRAIHELATFSDGLEPLVLDYKERIASHSFFNRMLRPLRSSEANGFDAALSSQLASYLTSPGITSRVDDDLSLVLATRLPPSASQGETIATATIKHEPSH